MKRFIALMLVLGALLLAAWYLVYVEGVYLSPAVSQSLSVPFAAQGKALTHREDNGRYTPFTMRCVEISASMPGAYASEYAATDEDYLRWLEAIADMGANTVKVRTIMDDDFYNALYTYNTTQEVPLYLLQQIPVSDAANYGSEDAFADVFLGNLLEDCHTAVDVIHGRKTIPLPSRGNGSGHYSHDLSPWVLGFVVGDTWSADTIAYTDHSSLHTEPYAGTYFSATADASPFEWVLAQAMDTLAAYETQKYAAQRPIGFSSGPDTDFLVYDENYALQLKKYGTLDAEHIQAQPANRAGSFAAYHLYDFCEDFSRLLSPGQSQELAPLLAELDTDSLYEGYLDLLARYHTMPVLCSGYGVSSARGITRDTQVPLTETEQGEALMEMYRDAIRFGWAGVSIATWQDEWENKTWNTAFATDMENRNLWHDLQTEGENFGLLAFTPTDRCVVDGQTDEWERTDPVQQTADGTVLYARYDCEALYLLIEGPAVTADRELCIPLDISPEVGVDSCLSPAVTFDRPAEFLLVVNGADQTRLLTQERNDPVRWNFYFEMTGRNAFAFLPDLNDPAFYPVRMAVENTVLLENYHALSAAERRTLTAMETWDTGLLQYGNGNPLAAEYNSLADFCFGENCVEIRLPWLLLNVASPAEMTVHRDYYQQYGAEFMDISQIWMGLAENGQAQLNAFAVKDTGRSPQTEERLKSSYEVVRDTWTRDKNL